jgi:hypothetical protein
VATDPHSLAITLCGILGFVCCRRSAAAGGFSGDMVSASLPGASPETMASSVQPLERSRWAGCRRKRNDFE